MAFSWDGRFVLRSLVEDDPDYHRIFMHSDDASKITDRFNDFTTAPQKVSRVRFEAVRFEASGSWEVTFHGMKPGITSGVFRLRSIK